MSRADETRGRILEAAGALLEARPGTPPSMSEIAGAAGVTRQLLYIHFANRADLLVALSRKLDEDARTPALQATIDEAPTARDALRAAVRVQAEIKPKIHGLATSLELLRPTDDAAAAACEEREEARLGRCRAVIDRLAAEGRCSPAWTPAAAAELMWSMTSLRSWEDLVHRRGWNATSWVERTTDALEAALLAPSSAARPGGADERPASTRSAAAAPRRPG